MHDSSIERFVVKWSDGETWDGLIRPHPVRPGGRRIVVYGPPARRVFDNVLFDSSDQFDKPNAVSRLYAELERRRLDRGGSYEVRPVLCPCSYCKAKSEAPTVVLITE
jgi:hypothetical protein